MKITSRRSGMALDLAELLADAGLTGRGGAAFSTAQKVAAAQDSGASLIVNACDGELDAAKDWFVVSQHLDELVHGAQLITSDVVYASRRGSPTVNLLRAAGLPVLEVPDRYVSSEESALVSAAHGDFARPVSRSRPLVFGGKDAEGRRLRPTLVLNAETVWRVSQILCNGPQWFRSFGTPDEPGPRLVTIAGAVAHPGVIESAAGTPIAKLLRQAGAAPYQAVSVGGLSSGFLSAPEAEQLRWESMVLGSHGCAIGSGVLRVIGADECPVEYVAHTLEVAAAETAGQCGPCMFGVPAVSSDFAAVAAGDTRRVPALHQRLSLLSGRGACHFPDGVSQHLAGALRVFGDDIDAHRAGRCVADHDRRNAHAS